MSDQDAGSHGVAPPLTCRATLQEHFDAGWPTEGVSPWTAGGYVHKERLVAALLVLADYIDRATNHPDARLLPEDGDGDASPERASA